MTPEQKLVFFLCLGLVILFIAMMVLTIFVFKPLHYKRMAASVDSSYQYSHSLLVGQDAQIIKRLEIISNLNLLYVDIHSNFLRKFKEIRDRNDSNALRIVNEMKDNLDDKKYKEFKDCRNTAVEIVGEFQKEVDEFTKKLQEVIQPEDDCRQAALESKNTLRNIKQEYFSKESQLTDMVGNFDEIFKYIDSLFQQFEEHLEAAHYSEANNVLPNIQQILEELSIDLKELPNLCVLVSKIIPEKIHEVELTYSLMCEEHYPLHNLFVGQTVEAMKKSISQLTEKIHGFDLDGVQDELNNIQSRIEFLMNQFEKEKEAKIVFDSGNESAYKKENEAQKRFITLKNTIPEVSEIYVINEEHRNKVEELDKDVNKVAAIKRLLDTYIHSATKQPYSLIVEKMSELDANASETIQKLDEFDSYLNSLKTDAETAYNLVFSTFEKVKKAEELVRKMNLKSINEKYSYQLETLYDLLNKINDLLNTQPIPVDEINNLIHDMSEISNKILDDGEILQDYNVMCLAESAITYGNKYRTRLAELDPLLSQAEVFFEKGDFVNANDSARTAISKIKRSNVR